MTMVSPENSARPAPLPSPPLALQGLRVLDRTQRMAGPFCGMLLADMGAEVIKVEPRDGDAARAAHPTAPGPSAGFLAVNRTKRGLALDLATPEGAAILRRLAADADVLIENDPPGAARRLGLDHEALRALNPRLIYCAISGFGQSGPYAGRDADDLIAQGMSGIMSATGSAGGPPAKVGVPVADLGAGLFAVFGILCALRARRVTGCGQRVDASLFEAGLALSAWEATEYWYTGDLPRPLGTAHRLNAPYQAFRASDGHFTVGAANNKLWAQFAALLGLQALVADPRFSKPGERLAHRAALEALIEAVTATKPRAHWLAMLEAAGIPAGPIYSIAEALADPQAVARGMTQACEVPGVGRVNMLGNPVKLSRTPARPAQPPPALGEDNAAILAELGYAKEDILRLRSSGVIS